MRKEIIQTGETVDQAIQSACMLLGEKQGDCEFEIIDLPKSSFFGLIKTPAKVKVWIDVEDEVAVIHTAATVEKVIKGKKVPPATPQPVLQVAEKEKEVREEKVVPTPVIKTAPPREVRPLDALDQEKMVLAAAYVGDIVKNMGIEAEIVTRVDSDIVTIAIEGKGLGTIIGRRGETLNALQYLTGLVANRLEGEYLRINVDAGDYRLKRNESLLDMTKKAVEEVLRTNISQALEAMNPAERRTVHSAAAEYTGVSSASVGSEPYRRVVIKTPTSTSPRDNRRRPSSPRDGERDNRRDGGRGREGRGKPYGERKPSSGSPNNRSRTVPKPEDIVPETPKAPVTPVMTKDTKGDAPLYGKIDFD